VATRKPRARASQTARRAPAARKPPKERTQFRQLLLANPNYFGTLAESDLPVVSAMEGNTTYEEITCVGYQPQFKRLEAVVHVKLPFGYGGGLCSPGTPEFVRFYLSNDDGATWQDLGVVSFQAYDVPGDKPLEYDVTLQVDPEEHCCDQENLPLVRAILSWNLAPPAGDPDFTPPWGNVVDARIQIAPLVPSTIWELLKCAKLEPPEIYDLYELGTPIELGKPKPLAAPQLFELYQGTKVPEHRFLTAEIEKFVAKAAQYETLSLPTAKAPWSEFEINLEKAISAYVATDGNTDFEELKCVGLNRDQDALVGVLTVKQSSGYSGNQCTGGSLEYVAFWVDWGDGAGWTYAGTTSVAVYDIAGIPAEGLQYSVFLPLNSFARRQPCTDGALTPRVRATLSWQTPPPPADPDWVPTWGNREETLVQVLAGPSVPANTPFIETVGSMAVSSIDTTTGLASGPAVAVGFTANDSPFGGQIFLTGHIANPPNTFGGGAAPLKYKVYVSSDGGTTWSPVATSFTIWISELSGAVWSGPTPQTQAPDLDGWYTYWEDISAPDMRFVAQNVLARWDTGPTMSGLWKIKMEAKDVLNNVYAGSQVITVRLDNEGPTASIAITSGGGPCGDFHIGDVISGTYSVSDNAHFGTLSFSVLPGGGAFTSPPLPRGYEDPVNPVPTTGENGTWDFDTSGMTPCGYVLNLRAWDRTIVNSGTIGWEAADTDGFCLKT
jgi:hypothetical protein